MALRHYKWDISGPRPKDLCRRNQPSPLFLDTLSLPPSLPPSPLSCACGHEVLLPRGYCCPCPRPFPICWSPLLTHRRKEMRLSSPLLSSFLRCRSSLTPLTHSLTFFPTSSSAFFGPAFSLALSLLPGSLHTFFMIQDTRTKQYMYEILCPKQERLWRSDETCSPTPSSLARNRRRHHRLGGSGGKNARNRGSRPT